MNNPSGWARARQNGLLPIGIIVAVAILCVVATILGSAKRADDVAAEHERALLIQAFSDRARRVLDEIDIVARSPAVYRNISIAFDPAWIQAHIGDRLRSTVDHNFVIVADSNDGILHMSTDRDLAHYTTSAIFAQLTPILDELRGRPLQSKQPVWPVVPATDGNRGRRAALIQDFLGTPAVVAAVAVMDPSPAGETPNTKGHALIAIRILDEEELAEIAEHANLSHLRRLRIDQVGPGEHVLELRQGNLVPIARFAWTPRRPGAEIISSTLPYVIVALAGFCLLAALIMRFLRTAQDTVTASEDRLRHLAMHDPLSGLPNRIYFGERLEHMIAEVAKGGSPRALFYIDLDHFKDVNDTLGHPVGDELICSVATRLRDTVRDGAVVARLGGDEFALLTTVATDSKTMHAQANRIINGLCAPYAINGQNIVIGASIGIALIDGRVSASADILRHADIALYRAKNEGRNRASIYDEVMEDALASRKSLEADLRIAIETGQISVAYQPVVNSSGEKLVGVEALCRWRHPERGDIPPAEFIPVAENSGLIVPLGEFVLRRACLDGKAWPGITVAVNVSPMQFRRSDFVEVVERTIRETGFDATRLELEVTESTLIGNLDSAELAMFRLKGLGARLALDDFGTGYSSLLYLRRFPFDKLKIDRGFVHSVEEAADAAAIVHAVIGLGRGLGMRVTAEGVETAEQHLFLRAAGVHSLQGYYFGRPGPASVITTRLGLAFPEQRPRPGDRPSLAMAG